MTATERQNEFGAAVTKRSRATPTPGRHTHEFAAVPRLAVPLAGAKRKDGRERDRRAAEQPAALLVQRGSDCRYLGRDSPSTRWLTPFGRSSRRPSSWSPTVVPAAAPPSTRFARPPRHFLRPLGPATRAAPFRSGRSRLDVRGIYLGGSLSDAADLIHEITRIQPASAGGSAVGQVAGHARVRCTQTSGADTRCRSRGEDVGNRLLLTA